MSSKVYSKAKLRWFRAVFKVVSNRYEELLKTPNYAEIVEDVPVAEVVVDVVGKSGKGVKDGEPVKPRLTSEEILAREKKQKEIYNSRKRIDRAKWRLGLNLYKAGEYFRAAPLLEYSCTGGSIGAKERGLDITYNCNT